MLKKLILILAALFLVAGCDDTTNSHCDEGTAQQRADFIAGCILSHSTGTADEVNAAQQFCEIQSQIHYCKAE